MDAINSSFLVANRMMLEKCPWWFSICCVCFTFLTLLLKAALPLVFISIVHNSHIEYPTMPAVIITMWDCCGYLMVILLIYGLINLVLSSRDVWRQNS